jgi:hypothetical protein
MFNNFINSNSIYKNSPNLFLFALCLFLVVLNCYEEDQENVKILPAGEGSQANQKRITTQYMTKYERARVLGTRALQIA